MIDERQSTTVPKTSKASARRLRGSKGVLMVAALQVRCGFCPGCRCRRAGCSHAGGSGTRSGRCGCRGLGSPHAVDADAQPCDAAADAAPCAQRRPVMDAAASAVSAPAQAPAAVGFGEALRFWLKLGFISFGGPAGQIAIMHAELVERRRWISEQRFLHALNYCMLLPGPEAQQLATYIGWLMHRTWGGIVAGALFVLPSLVVLVALSWLYMAWGGVPAVAAVLYGIKPAVVAIVAHAAWRIGSRVLRHPALWAIAALAFVAIFAVHVPFPAIVIAAGILGALGGRFAPRAFQPGGHRRADGGAHLPAVIDDDTPTPPHARFRGRQLALVVAVGAALWLFAVAMLVASFGPGAPLPRMGWFF